MGQFSYLIWQFTQRDQCSSASQPGRAAHTAVIAMLILHLTMGWPGNSMAFGSNTRKPVSMPPAVFGTSTRISLVEYGCAAQGRTASRHQAVSILTAIFPRKSCRVIYEKVSP